MANALKKSAVPLKVSTPVEAAVAAFKAVQPSEVKLVAAPAALAAAPAALAAAPAAEIQQSFRSALEKGVVESRAVFSKAKTKADDATSALEVSFAAAKDGALAINTRAFEAMRLNADANFDFWKAVFAVKSLPDLIALQTEFARKQIETITGQSKDFGAIAQKAMAAAVEPIKEQVARSFKLAV